MKTIQTLKGPLDIKDVKAICPHEHLILDMTHEAVLPETEEEKELFFGEVRMNNLGILRRNPYIVRSNLILDSVDDAIEELSVLTKYNCNLLIDLTTVGLGRDIKKLQSISQQTEINLVIGCGLFVHDAVPEPYKSWNIEQIATWMLDEIQIGIENTNLRAGVIGEIGVSETIYPMEERSLRAVALVNQKTDLPVFLHIYPWSHAGLDAVDLLLQLGVKPEKICICHLDVTFNEEYIFEALEAGIYLEFDNFGKEFYFESQDGAFSGGPFETDVARVKMLKKLINQGYSDKILMANDICLKESLHKYGGWGYDHVFRNIAPMMRMEGISESDIKQILFDNPKLFLFGTK